jgi:hypothetical protein
MVFFAINAGIESSNSRTGLPAPRRECVPIMKASNIGCKKKTESEEGNKCLKSAQQFRDAGAVFICVCVWALIRML